MTKDSSTTNRPSNPSATNRTEQELYQQQLNTQNKPPTLAQIKANGDIRTRMGILWLTGVVCVLLIIFGGLALLLDSPNAKDMWIVIGPILTASVTGTAAFFTQDKKSK